MTRSIGEELLDSVNRMFDFSGRSTRRQFWYFIAFCIVISALVPILGTSMSEPAMLADPVAIDVGQVLSDYMLRQGLLFAVFLIPLMSVTTRRLHDAGWSGLWAAPLLILHLAVFLLQAKVLADSVQLTSPEQSPFYGTFKTLTLFYNAATIGIVILCVLKSDPCANGYGDPQYD
jgi:uncharacterized membrane protein YhaH (DUF805 family)